MLRTPSLYPLWSPLPYPNTAFHPLSPIAPPHDRPKYLPARKVQPATIAPPNDDNNGQFHLSHHDTAREPYRPLEFDDRPQIVSDHKITCLPALTKLFFAWKIPLERLPLQTRSTKLLECLNLFTFPLLYLSNLFLF